MTAHQVLVCVLLLCGPTPTDTDTDTEPEYEHCAVASSEASPVDPGSVPASPPLGSEPDQPQPVPTEPSSSAAPCPADPEPLAAPPEAPGATPDEEPSQGHTGGQQAQQGQQRPEREPAAAPEHGVADEPTEDRSPTDPRGTGLSSHRPVPASPAASEKGGPAFREPAPGGGSPAATATVPAPVPSQAGASEGDDPNPVGHFAFDDPTPSSAVTRVIGTASATLLCLLGIGVLALRLTVGWPRFPTLYLGRRRSGALD